MQEVGQAFMEAVAAFFAFLPTLLGAVLLLILGWIIAVLIGRLVHKALEAAGFERAVERSGAGDFFRESRWTGSKIVAALVKWFVFLLFVVAAANILGMPQITLLMNAIVLFIPRLIVAVVIIILGALLARILAGIVHAALTRSEVGNEYLISKIVQYGVIAVAVVAALNQIQVATVAVNTLFIGLVAAASLALGLAFGLGARGVAADIAESWHEGRRRARRLERPEEEPPRARRSGGGGI